MNNFALTSSLPEWEEIGDNGLVDRWKLSSKAEWHCQIDLTVNLTFPQGTLLHYMANLGCRIYSYLSIGSFSLQIIYYRDNIYNIHSYVAFVCSLSPYLEQRSTTASW